MVYSSDDDGFVVEASNIPTDTDVVAQAKNHHQALFESIAEQHAKIGEELRVRALEEEKRREKEEAEQELSG